MDKVQAEFDSCAALLKRLNNQRSALHSEISRRLETERVQLLGCIEPLDNNYEWRLAMNSLIAHSLTQFDAALPRLTRQSQRVDHTLTKMNVARPAMSWRVREIDALLLELQSYGLNITAADMSAHLWDQMLDKLRTKPGEPDTCVVAPTQRAQIRF